MAAKKKADAAKATETEPTTGSVPVGHLWEFDADERVSVTRPDGSQATLAPNSKGKVRLRLDASGEYTAGDQKITVK